MAAWDQGCGIRSQHEGNGLGEVKPCLMVVLTHLFKMIPPEDAVVLVLLYVHCVVNSAEEYEMPRCYSSVWSELQGRGLAAALNSFPERPGVYRQVDPFYNSALWMVWG